MKDISIILPTRGRPYLLKRLLESIAETASNPQGLEVVLYLDQDDAISQAVSFPRLELVKLIRPAGESMGNIINQCYQAGCGRYVILMNDDVVFRTLAWDETVLRTFAQFPDELALVYGNDLDQGQHVPTFPILSRKICTLMGGVCPAEYLNLHIETHLLDIFKQLDSLGHNRIVYLEDVVFEHMHFVVGKAGRDKTYVKKDMGYDDRLFISLADERSYMAEKLARYIDDFRGQCDEVNYKADRPNTIVSFVVTDYCTLGGNGHKGLEWLASNDLATTWEVLVVSDELTEGRLLKSYPQLKGCLQVINSSSLSPSPLTGEGWDGGVFSIGKCTPHPSPPPQGGRELGLIKSSDTDWGNLLKEVACYAKGIYLSLLDDMVSPQAGWLKAMLQVFEKDRGLGIAGSKLIDPRNGRIKHAGICFYGNGEGLKATYVYNGLQFDHPLVNNYREYQAVSRFGMFIKKEAVSNIFDVHFNDEVELCFNVRQKGGKVAYIPEAGLNCWGEPVAVKDFSVLPGVKSDLEGVLALDGFDQTINI